MNSKFLLLRLTLWSVCVVNLFLGVVAFLSQRTILEVIHALYRVPLNSLEEHTIYIVKMLGCLLIAIGVMAGIAARKPAENRTVILGNAIWLSLRGIQRITYVERFHRDWGISYGFLWTQVAIVFLIAVLLLWLMPRGSMNSADAAAT